MTDLRASVSNVHAEISWRVVLGGIVLIFGLAVFVTLAQEWWIVIVRAEPAQIKLYPFGTELGWTYSSPRVYGWSSLFEATVVLLVALFVRLSLVRRSWRWAIGAAAIVALASAGTGIYVSMAGYS